MSMLDGIKKPIVWVPALATVLSAIIIVVASGLAGWDRDPTFPDEQKLVMGALELDVEQRQAKLCEFHHSGLFQSERVIDKIATAVIDDPKCTKDGYSPHIPTVSATAMGQLAEADRQRVTNCLQVSSPVTSSCQAYDKSGLHARPGDSCGMSLKPDEGRFFAQDRVTVLSQAYRQRSGLAAGDAMKPTKDDSGLIRTFSGTIGCTNDRGTGRTCSASATVRAISFPDHCADLRDILKNAK